MSVPQLSLSRALTLLVCGVVLIAMNSVAARQVPAGDGAVIYRGVLTPERFDISPPLRDIPERPQPLALARKEELHIAGPLGPQDVDLQVQRAIVANEIPATSASFDAFNGLGPTPPDPVGDVGPNHYVAMANLRYAVYSKTGASVFGPVNTNTLWAGFGGPCQTENAGDPVVIYDQLADRWVLMQFTAAGPSYFVCLAVSTTPDPAGTFYRYGISTGANFPDYPKLAMWANAYIITTREFLNGASFSGIGAYALNRAQALAGNPAAQIISFLATPGATPYRVGDGLLPADLDGATLPPGGSPAYLIGSQDNGGPYGAPSDALNIWRFAPNFTTPASSTLTLTDTLPVAAFDSMFPCTPGARDCIPQPGTTQKLDHQGYRQRVLHRAAYRNLGTHEALVTNQSVEASPSMSGIRWYEIRALSSTPVVHQEGTYAPGVTDGIHRWFGSIAMDSAGNMGLGYSASNATTTFPSMWYTGRLSGDTLGTMPQGEGVFINGTGSQTASARWGDYTSMNIDPTDDCTFWYINEYYPVSSPNAWRLRIGSFKFPSCGAPQASITSLWPVGTVRPGGTARFWALVRNDGGAPLPADAKVWFWTDVAGAWVGYANVAGLAAGASAWYFYDFVIPAAATAGTRGYWAQVWTDAGAISAYTGPQNFTVDRRTVSITQLWPATGAYPGGTVRLWALVRNLNTIPQPSDAKAYFWATGPGWTGDHYVGFANIAGLAPGASVWHYFDWSIPAAATPGLYEYWGQAWNSIEAISDWRGPQQFPVGFNSQFNTSMDNWMPVTGSWSQVSGAYLFTDGLATTGSSVRRPAITRHLDYQARLWRSGCQSCANRIMVRGIVNPLGSTNWWNSHFVFQYTADGQFSVYKTVGGTQTLLQNWTSTPAINQGGAWNRLRVVSHNDTLLYYINDVLVWVATDASLPAAGEVGIGMFNDSSAGNGFWVDWATGYPTGLTADSADRALLTERVSDAQQRLNAAANARPAGNINRSREP